MASTGRAGQHGEGSRRPPAGLAVALLLAAASAARPVRAVALDRTVASPSIYGNQFNWDHPELLVPTEDQIFRHTPYRRDFQTRSYYWLGILDNGWVVVLSPFRWTYGVLGSWGLNIIAMEPGGRVFSYDGRLGDGAPQVAEAGMRIGAGSSSFESYGMHHRWRIEVSGFSCDITFDNVLPPWMPGDGVANFTPGGEYYSQYSLPAPWATVSGTMTVFGRTVSAAGQCLLDSSETLLPVSRTNSRIWAFRTFSPPGTPAADRWMVAQLTTFSHAAFGSLRLPMLLIAHGHAWVLTVRDFTCEPVEEATIDDPPYPWPSRFEIWALQNGVAFQASVFCDPPYYVTDIFAKLPRPFRTVASWFLKRPVIFRHLARLEGTVWLPDGTTHRLELAGQAEYLVSK